MTKFRSQKFKKEAAKKLLKISADDLYAAEFLSTAPKFRPETIVFLAQQSIEKAIKAVTVHLEIAVYLTHDLEVLLNTLPESLTKDLPDGIGALTQYATIRRYSEGDEIIEPSDISAILNLGKLYFEWANGIVQPG